MTCRNLWLVQIQCSQTCRTSQQVSLEWRQVRIFFWFIFFDKFFYLGYYFNKKTRVYWQFDFKISKVWFLLRGIFHTQIFLIYCFYERVKIKEFFCVNFHFLSIILLISCLSFFQMSLKLGQKDVTFFIVILTNNTNQYFSIYSIRFML